MSLLPSADTPPPVFRIQWSADRDDSRFSALVRFESATGSRTMATGRDALVGLAICLGRILARGFACAPQCSGALVCLEAASLDLELLQTSVLVELVFEGTSGPDIRVEQRAFFDGASRFLEEVLEWARAQPVTDGNEQLRELDALTEAIQALPISMGSE